MDKLFKIFKKKEEVKTEEVENKEGPEKLRLIDAVRRYSPSYIQMLVFGIGLVCSVQISEIIRDKLSDYNSYHEKRKRVIDGYKDVLGPEEYVKFQEFLKSNHMFFIDEDSYQQNIQKITDDFPITASELVALDNRVIMDNIDTLVHDEKIMKALSEIKASEKEGLGVGISIVPIRDISLLRDVKYVENMKKVVSLGVENTGPRPRIISDSLRNNLQKISDLAPNIRFDGNLLYYDEEDIVVSDSLPYVKENLDNAYINSSLIYNLGNSHEAMKKWDKFFSNPKNKAIFSILQHEGYSISSFHFLAHRINNIDSFFQDEGNVKFFLTLADNVRRQDLNKEEVMGVINYATNYYTHGKYDSLEKIIPDIVEVNKNKSRMSLDELNTHLGRVGVYQNIYLPLIQETPKEYRLEEGFFEDPSLQYVRQLGYHKKPPALLAGMTHREQASWIMQTCRMMKTTNAECTESVFNEALQSLMETRSNPEILNTKLFANRNVAIMGHNETYKNTSFQADTSGENIITTLTSTKVDRFAKDSLISGIKNQEPKIIKLFKASEDLKDLSSKKKEFINFIKTSKNLTIFVDAHGSPEAVSFSEGLPDNNGAVQGQELSNSVYYNEIGDALINRFHSGIVDRAILIDNACMNFEFIQNLYRHIQYHNESTNEKVPLPIAVGMSEMGQYGFSSFESSYGSIFTENLLKGSEGRVTNIGDVLEIERDGKGMLSNVSVFIPHTIEIQKFVSKKTSPTNKTVPPKVAKVPSVATGSVNKGNAKSLEQPSFEFKKVKIEKPFQIAENEQTGSGNQDIFSA